MCICARLSKFRVVFLEESEDSGTCCFSCSKQCRSWARLHTESRKINFPLAQFQLGAISWKTHTGPYVGVIIPVLFQFIVNWPGKEGKKNIKSLTQMMILVFRICFHHACPFSDFFFFYQVEVCVKTWEDFFFFWCVVVGMKRNCSHTTSTPLPV